jgi:hypothetical protein
VIRYSDERSCPVGAVDGCVGETPKRSGVRNLPIFLRCPGEFEFLLFLRLIGSIAEHISIVVLGHRFCITFTMARMSKCWSIT